MIDPKQTYDVELFGFVRADRSELTVVAGSTPATETKTGGNYWTVGRITTDAGPVFVAAPFCPLPVHQAAIRSGTRPVTQWPGDSFREVAARASDQTLANVLQYIRAR